MWPLYICWVSCRCWLYDPVECHPAKRPYSTQISHHPLTSLSNSSSITYLLALRPLRCVVLAYFIWTSPQMQHSIISYPSPTFPFRRPSLKESSLPPALPPFVSLLSSAVMAHHSTHHTAGPESNGSGVPGHTNSLSPPPSSKVTQALEIARDSPEGAQDPEVRSVLEKELEVIWGKIQREPQVYVMTREEFAIFNFYQGRFEGVDVAAAARKRYWDSLHSQ